MSLRIGSHILRHGLVLAPMAGVTDHSFRVICHERGAEWTVSEMVSSKALVYEQKCRKSIENLRSKTAPLAAVHEDDAPMAVQLFGSDPAIMAEAAARIAARDYRGCESPRVPDAIDINMGCPMPKITGNGDGSALMRDPDLAGKVVRAVVDAVPLPVTVKIRAGWDSDSINAPEMAKILEANGAAVICVHARTREQMYNPGISLPVIRAVKNAVKIPVIGNGDIGCAGDAVTMLRETGCDGLMIGRGALGNPWIFTEIRAALEGGDFTPPAPRERIEVALDQANRMIAEKGERVGLAEARKHLAWYTRGMHGAAAARNEIMTAEDPAVLAAILRGLVGED